MIDLAFAGFAVIAWGLFRFIAAPRAVAIICMGGWLLLPVGHFPSGAANAIFPYWITGTATPSGMLFTKIWLVPLVALAGAIVADRQSWMNLRFGWIDVPMGLWCIWPVIQWPVTSNPEPWPVISALYLAASWGAPWLLGRVYFSGRDGGILLMKAVAAGVAVLAPIALIEGIFGTHLYGWLYETHPFRNDGALRYIGFRPLGFLENGNHYGIWIAMTAFAALWLWAAAPDRRVRGQRLAIAILALAVALAGQSIGGLLILACGMASLQSVGRRWVLWCLPTALIGTVLLGGVYLSGAIPLQHIAKDTAIGQKIVRIGRAAGRGSFTWRIARDPKALAVIARDPIAGSGRWDWWRVNTERPWGLAFQILGQFGAVGLLLAFGALLFPALRALAENWRVRSWREEGVAIALAVIVLMALMDAILNAFLFYPAILSAGALATALSVSRPGSASRRSAPVRPDISASRSSDSDQ